MKEKAYKSYVGADLHKLYTHFSAQTRIGKEVCNRRVENNPEDIRGFLAAMPAPVLVAVEATGNSAWFCDVVRGDGHDIVVAHPNETRARAGTKEKNDRFDARTLATLLRGNLIKKQAWQAPEEVRRARERLRHMQLQRKTMTAHKNKIHSILIRLNLRSLWKDLFCKKGRQYLRGLELAGEYRTTIDRCLATIEMIEGYMRDDVAWCEQLAQREELVWMLDTIPGIDAQLAAMIYYETGDISRFDRVDAYINYTGLVPGKRQSGERSTDIGITKEGSFWLRWAFVQAAQTAERQRGGRLARFYWRQMRKGHSRNTAVVATAREIATIAYYIMKRRQGYYEPLPSNKKAS